MFLHDLQEWIRSSHGGRISLPDFTDALKRGDLANINMPRDAVRKTVREVLGATAVERGISNAGLFKLSFFELFPKFFEVDQKMVCAKSPWRPGSRARERSSSQDSFYSVASGPRDERARERDAQRSAIRERGREQREQESKRKALEASSSSAGSLREKEAPEVPEPVPETPERPPGPAALAEPAEHTAFEPAEHTSYAYRTPPRPARSPHTGPSTPMPMLCSLDHSPYGQDAGMPTPQMRFSQYDEWAGKDTGMQMIGLPGGYCVVMQYIATLNAAVQAVDQLRAATVIAVDCEGVKLSATGELTLVQVAFASATRLNVLVFDVVALGVGVRVLHRILEEPRPLKLLHDLRMDAAALHEQFGISLQGIFDTQLAHLIAEGNFTPLTPGGQLPLMIGLNGFLQWCHIPGNDKKVEVKKQMAGDDQVWKRRPISMALLRYAVQDVALLLLAWPHLRQTLGPTQVEMCKRASERRAATACGHLPPAVENTHFVY